MVERESAWSSLSGVSALLNEARAVSFSFYTKEEVRRLSSVRISSSRQRDVMSRPLPGGLYDARMGPTDHYESCVTCGLDYALCPGHFGHIELPLPAYAQLLFPLMHVLLRAACRECHHFRAPRIRLEPFAAALGLLDAGLLADAATVLENSGCVKGAPRACGAAHPGPMALASVPLPVAAATEQSGAARPPPAGNSKLGNNEVATAGGALEETEHAYLSKVSAEGRRVLLRRQPGGRANGAVGGEMQVPMRGRGCSSPHLVALRKRVYTALAKALRPGSARCSCCGKASGQLKTHGGKLFVSALSQRSLAANSMLGEGRASDGRAGRRSTPAEPSPQPRRGRSAGASEAGAGAALPRSTTRSTTPHCLAGGCSAVEEEGEDADSDDDDDDDQEEEEAAEAADGTEEMVVEDEVEAQRQEAPVGKSLFLNPSQAMKEMEALWQVEGDLLRQLYPTITVANFFQEVLVVPPNRFRPPAKVGDQLFDHSQNVWLSKILTAMETLHRIKAQWQEQQEQAAAGDGEGGPAGVETNGSVIPPMTDQRLMERYMAAWDEMCSGVACIVDSNKEEGTASGTAQTPAGVKQMLERKAGLFRSHMMGKRVNYCCRSVISPDVNLGTHEIGVPLHFAKELTFPEPVTPWNVKELRHAVVNGPDQHPGANFVQDASGETIDLRRRSRPQRVAIAARLLADADGGAGGGAMLGSTLGDLAALSTRHEAGMLGTPRKPGAPVSVGGTTPHADECAPSATGAPGIAASAGSGRSNVAPACKKVWRHLISGDVLLVNRQPTLHKPGIMAHVARVLKSEKVIRMHYANCNTYNADFDGDEMNLHLCQSHLARAEAYHIAATDHQYIAPTNGKPLRGLIQDHVVRRTARPHIPAHPGPPTHPSRANALATFHAVVPPPSPARRQPRGGTRATAARRAHSLSAPR